MFDRRKSWMSLAVLVLTVVLIRAVLFPFDVTQTDISFDIDRWLETARNIVAGKGYSLSTRLLDEPQPTAMRGPTVVYFFSAVLWLFGDSAWAILIAQWLVDAATSIILFFIALEVFRDRRVALITSIMFAVYLPGLIFSFRGWSEPVFTLTLAAFVLSLLSALARPSGWRFAASGAWLAVATLARPSMQFYVFIILPLLWWAKLGAWRQVLRGFSCLCLAFAAILSPWIVRNFLVFNAFVPASSYSGVPFYEANFALGEPDYLRQRSSEEGTTNLRRVLEKRFGPANGAYDLWSYARLKGLDEVEVNNIATEEVLRIVREFPGRYIILSGVRFLRLWFHHRFVNFVVLGGPVPKAWMIAAFNATLLGLGILGLILCRNRSSAFIMSILALIAYSSVLYAATNVVGRYIVPTMPYVMMFAAYALVRIGEMLGVRDDAGTMRGAAAVRS